MTSATSASVQLFVYGSLKRGGRHHHELAGAAFLGPAETIAGYRLEPLGEYLSLVSLRDRRGPSASTDGSTVQGELFELPASKLPALDAFEGDSYVRGEVQVRFRRTNQPAGGRCRGDAGGDAGAKMTSKLNEPNRAEVRFALAYFKKAR